MRCRQCGDEIAREGQLCLGRGRSTTCVPKTRQRKNSPKLKAVPPPIANALPNNVVSIRSVHQKKIFRQLDVRGRQPVLDRMVGVTDVSTVSLLGCGADSDCWELTPQQAEHLGISLIQVAAQCRIETGDKSDD